MANDPKIDEMLARFLQNQEADREAGFTPKALHGSLQTLATRQLQFEAKVGVELEAVKGEHRGLSLRVGVVEKAQEKLEGKVEDTGKHDLDALQKQLDEKKRELEKREEEKKKELEKRDDRAHESRSHWRRYGVGVLVGVIVSVLTAVIITQVTKPSNAATSAPPAAGH